jgi:8-amino-7-oxononanoate synthase
MHPLLARSRAVDVTTVLAERTHEAEPAIVGFYDRRSKAITRWTHADFIARAFGFAASLRSELCPGDPVIIACATPESALSAYISVLACGGLPLIHSTRPAFEDQEQARDNLARQSQALGGRAIILATSTREPQDWFPAGVRVVQMDLDTVTPDPDFEVTPPATANAPLHLQSTSGTTGTGKLAVVSHQNVVHNVNGLLMKLDHRPTDRFVSWLPLYHDMGLLFGALSGILANTDLYLMSPFDFLAEPGAWLRIIDEVRGTTTSSPNFGFAHVLRRVRPDQVAGLDLSCWRHCLAGAEPLDARTLLQFARRFRDQGLDVESIGAGYGLAEATLLVSIRDPGTRLRAALVDTNSVTRLGAIELRSSVALDDLDAEAMSPDESVVVALGTAAEGIEIELIDGQGSRVTDPLACGEIVVRGSSVTLGYLRPNGSIEPHEGGAFRTGDIGFWHDDELFVVERIKNTIIRNGENHSAAVMELELAGLLGRSVDDIVVLDSDVRPGHGRVTAVVGIARNEATEPIVDRVRLATFEPPIEQLVLVPRGALARTSSGKRQHAALRSELQDGSLSVISHHELIPVVAAGEDLNTVIDIDAVDERFRIMDLIELHARERGSLASVEDTTRLVQDLGFDSLALYELAVDLESATGVNIPENLVASMKRVQDVIEVVRVVRGEPATGRLMRSIKELGDAIPQRLCVATAQRGRQVLIDGRWISDFASCNYLGLDVHPDVIASVAPALQQWGVHPSWTRAVASPLPYRELEAGLAHLVGAPDVVVFPTVTLAHIGVLPQLAGPRGTILIDRAAHNSIQEAAQLASARGTTIVPFAHNDLDSLAGALARASRSGSRIIAIDGVYSISGCTAPLPEILALAERHDATIYVDDAHGFGILGEHPSTMEPWGHRGNGVVKYFGLGYERIVYVGGLSKAYSSLAAFVTANDAAQREQLQGASTSVFSGPIPVASLATSLAAIEVNEREGDELRAHLRALTTRLVAGARDLGFCADNPLDFPIVTLVLGSLATVELGCRVLWDQGILLTPAVFPAAPLDRGGVRFTITAANTASEVEGLISALAAMRDEIHGAEHAPSLVASAAGA